MTGVQTCALPICYAPVAAALAPLTNLRNHVPALAALMESWVGFSARRSLPTWRRDWFQPSEAGARGQGREVVLFVDTFSTYFEPENARAAMTVLTRAGYDVIVPKPLDGGRRLCCGRTFLAEGLVDQARAEAGRMLAALAPYVSRGVKIVGLEPSCLFTLKDEFLALLPGAEAEALAANTLMFEEFIALEAEAGRFKPAFVALPERTALVHGHCHQKAFAAMSAVSTALRLIPDLDVKMIDSSCCGMAGAFGYEAAHYDISMKMAELSLLPAVRAAAADTLLVADGTSCRHQIHDGSGREAIHVARVLERALAPAY